MLGKSSKKLRYSLLLHSEAAKGSHDWQHTVTSEIKDQFIKACGDDSPIFYKLIEISYENLKHSLILNNEPIPTLAEVAEEVKKAVTNDYITIIKVNSDEDVSAMLDNSGQLKLRSPLNIFIGGQVLDRGVTLANLIGFYYGRRPNKYQQDTVLQHSRMYGYRRMDLAVTRFYTSTIIRNAMFKMEEFDSSLRAAIEAGGDKAVQFICKAADDSIIPCNPNKILISNIQTLRPHKRLLPFGFQTGYKTGEDAIGGIIKHIDQQVEKLCGFNAEKPVTVSIDKAIKLLDDIQSTLLEEADTPPFDWDTAKVILAHLAQLHTDPRQRGQVLLWAANNRNSARKASERSHVSGGFIETPDSEKTEGKLTKKYAMHHPILFLLRQNGSEEKGWRGTPFYWPVIRAQLLTPVSVYASKTL